MYPVFAGMSNSSGGLQPMQVLPPPPIVLPPAYMTPQAHRNPTPGGPSRTNTEGKARLIRKKVQHTFSGQVRKVKKPRRKARTPKKVRKGMVVHQEQRGSVADPKVVYLAHTTCVQENILKSLAGTIVKELFRKRGVGFSKWQETYLTADTESIQFRYYQDPGNVTIVSGSVTITSGQTFQTISQGLLDAIRSSFSANSVHEVIDFRYLRGGNTTLVKISAKALKVGISVTSVLTMQNQTLGGTTAASTASTDVVTTNPLRGHKYDGRGSGFIPYERKETNASYQKFVCNSAFGVLTRTQAISLPEQGNEPPKGWFWKGCKRVGIAKVEPGQIRKSVLKTNVNISLMKLLELFEESFNATGDKLVQYFGKIRMFALEKVLDSGLSENNITLAWEVDCIVSTTINYSNYIPTAPYNVIN